MATKVFLDPPAPFVPEVTIVGCYCVWNEKFLLLKRHPETLSGGRWCLPGGKLEEGESRLEGARRELCEEAGVALAPKNLSHCVTFYIERGDLRYDFAVYRTLFEKKPNLELNLREHTEAKWVTHKEAQSLPLIDGGDQILDTLRLIPL